MASTSQPPYPPPTFDPSRVGVVANGANLLIRGNFPLNSSLEWSYGGLQTALQSSLGSSFSLGAYNLLDIIILDNTYLSEGTWLTDELSTFGVASSGLPFSSGYPPYANDSSWNPTVQYGSSISNTDNGATPAATLMWWPLETQQDSTPTDSSWETYLVPTWSSGSPTPSWTSGYGFDAAVANLDALFTTASDTPLAIYFHCSQGTDRTGALCAGYLLYTQAASNAADAITQATNLIPAQIAPVTDYQQLVAAYAQNQFGMVYS